MRTDAADQTQFPEKHSAPAGSSSTLNPREQFKEDFTQARIAHWDNLVDKRSFLGRAYEKLNFRAFRQIVPKGSAILEIGCGHGDLLANLEPSRAVGIDFSESRLREARKRHPGIKFIQADGHELPAIDEEFDYIILSDFINGAFDVQEVLEQVRKVATYRTRILITFRSHFWSLPIKLARKLSLADDSLDDNWLTLDDVRNLLMLSEFDAVRNWNEIILPLDIPVLGTFLNRYLPKIWPFSHLAFSHFVIARPKHTEFVTSTLPSVTVMVPARNEAGHIEDILARVPKMGSATEIVFVEGGSSDNTYETIENALKTFDRMPARLFQQTGKGKGNATRLGFEKAENDILMILDADITVMPEDLPKFYRALVTGSGELINGVRLVYPMEEKAMRFLNFLGNKFFSASFSYLLGQPIKDTLCGTKVLYKKDWDRILAARDYFGDFDPFGDFDIIFGAAKQNMKIIDMPIRYRERVYGDTNINRWQGGYLLLRMLLVAFRKLKFS